MTQKTHGRYPRLRSSLAAICLGLAVVPQAADADYEPADRGFESLTVEAVYTSDLWRNVAGGIREDSAYLDNLDVTAELDAESAFGWQGTRFFVYGLYNNGTPFSETIVGDAQIISNIETGVEAARLYEAWVERRFTTGTSFLFGLYDLNSEFDVLDSSGLFLNSAHGIGTDIAQTGENGPSIFPATSLALRLTQQLSETWSARLAVLDGVPGDPADPGATRIRLGGDDGALVIGELEWSPAHGKLLMGAWRYTADFERLDTEVSGEGSGNDGLYLRGEWSPRGTGSPLTLFSRYGIADGRFNTFDSFFGAGLTHRLPWGGSAAPVVGLAMALAEASDEYLAAEAATTGTRPEDTEVKYELTLRSSVNERISLQPSIQYIVNPGLRTDLSDALALGLRVEITIL